jgi:hypothetical protein
MFTSAAGDAVMDCHGPSKKGNGVDGLARTGRAASTCGRGLGWGLAFSDLPTPEHDASSSLEVGQHSIASPHRPPHLAPYLIMSMLDSRLHAAAHLRAQSPPPLLADRISTRDLFLKKTVTLSDVDKLDQRCL